MTDALALYEALASRGTSPALTWYSPMGRVELSGRVAAQHMAKVAGYLEDEVWIEPGATVLIDMPACFKQVVWGLGALLAGARVVVGGPDDALQAAVVVTNRPEEYADRGQNAELCAVDPAPLALSWMGPTLDHAVRDATAEVMGSPDVLMNEDAHAASNASAWMREGNEAFLIAPTPRQALASAAANLGRRRVVIVDDPAAAEQVRITENV